MTRLLGAGGVTAEGEGFVSKEGEAGAETGDDAATAGDDPGTAGMGFRESNITTTVIEATAARPATRIHRVDGT
jgi:hypothetical protein